MKLLNPGPVTLTSRVRNALLGEDLCHREVEFGTLQTEIRNRLVQVYPDMGEFISVLITGSGTSAVEAMVGTLVPKDGHVLVMSNGVYGERIQSILEAQGKHVYVAASAYTEPMNLPSAEKLLKEHPEITHVCAVHHETTTGRLNDISAIAELCKKHEKKLLLDTVSSFGGEVIDFKNWNIEAVAATANKCLHGVPGVAFVIVKKEVFSTRSTGATGVYLDLFKHFPEQDKGSTVFTQSAQLYYALLEALKELEDMGGVTSRHAQYRKFSEYIFDEFKKLNIEPLLPIETPSSSILTAYKLPSGITYTHLHDILKEQGFVIYAGQGTFREAIFRLAVMGDLDLSDLRRLVEIIKGLDRLSIASQK